VPPYFAATAEEISDKTGVDFMQLWGWESERLMTLLGIPEELGEVSTYIHRPGSKGNLPGASSNVSEVFKSAFLRCLAWFHFQQLLPEAYFLDYSLKVCPIDLSLWDIASGTVPDWWPRAISGPSEISTLPEWDECSRLSELRICGRQLLAAEGAVIPARLLTRSHFSLLPFAYRIRGPVDNVCEKLHHRLGRCAWVQSPLEHHLLAAVDGPSYRGWIPLHESSTTISGVELQPLVAGMRLLNINSWQYWRILHEPFFPTPYLWANDSSVGHDENSWFYETGGKRVFEGRDWQIGSLERTDDREYALTGQYAVCDPDWLKGFLDEKGFRLAHVLRVTVRQRKYEHEDPKEFDGCRLLNLSSVVI